MDPNIGASLPEEEHRRLQENFDAVVSAVRRKEAARRDEEQPQNQGDQPRGSAVQSPEHPTMIQHEHSSINGQQAHDQARVVSAAAVGLKFSTEC